MNHVGQLKTQKKESNKAHSLDNFIKDKTLIDKQEPEDEEEPI